ncbi:MAG: histidinol phosphate phosphatase domain-containing protein [Candidatus Omnitrophota bacterium]|jgi:histidinol phosphatase-like PHP family hydrolase
MYNLHCHSLLSDGALLPSEVAIRYADKGYKAIAITDHADYSNIEQVTRAIMRFTEEWPRHNGYIRVLPGIELTHLPLEQFNPLVRYARKKGIKIIVGHGETPVEPVLKGTNRAALEAGVDILAHPGLISEDDASLAASKGIFLELTSRRGHSDTNPAVVAAAAKSGASLVLDTDGHQPQDIIAPADLKMVGLNAGLSEEDIDGLYSKVGEFLDRKGIKNR